MSKEQIKKIRFGMFLFLLLSASSSFSANESESILSHQLTNHLLARSKKSGPFPKNLKKSINIRSKKQSIPPFDRKNPKAKGVIITFNKFPPDKIKIKPLLKKLKKERLRLKDQFPFFKSWVFEWTSWQKAKKAQILCLELVINPQLSSFVKVCEPDSLLGPAKINKDKFHGAGSGTLSEGYMEEPIKEPNPPFFISDNRDTIGNTPSRGPASVFTDVTSYRLKRASEDTHLPDFQINMSRNLKSCGIVSKKIKKITKCGSKTKSSLPDDLPDYWAQEMIGADLLKEELKKNNFSGPNSHLISIHDSVEEDHYEPVFNLIMNRYGKENMSSILPSSPSYGYSYHEVHRISSYTSYFRGLCRATTGPHATCSPSPSFVNNSMGWGHTAYCGLRHQNTTLLDDMIKNSRQKGTLTIAEEIGNALKDTSKREKIEADAILSKRQYQLNYDVRGLSDKQIKELICSTDHMSTYRVYKEMASLGTVIVTAAGNDHPDIRGPSGQRYIEETKAQASEDFGLIVVGSIDPFRERSVFSQEGRVKGEVDIMAPSDYSIISGQQQEPCLFSGTSGATPLVTASLAGFEWLSGYHPTVEEAEALLKKTAIPYLFSKDSDDGTSGVGIVNAYKLGRVAQKLKIQCKKNDRSCFKNAIQEDQTYQFDRDPELSSAIARAFPECAVCGSHPLKTGAATCNTKRDVFTRLRKETFLHPEDRELWDTLACVYGSSDFKKTAKGITNTYRSLSGTQGVDAYSCDKHEDCVLYPVPPRNESCHEDLENISALEVVNKMAFRIKNIRKNIGKCCQWKTACMRQWCHSKNKWEVTPTTRPISTSITRKWYYQARCSVSPKKKCSVRFKHTRKRIPLNDEVEKEEIDATQ